MPMQRMVGVGKLVQKLSMVLGDGHLKSWVLEIILPVQT